MARIGFCPDFIAIIFVNSGLTLNILINWLSNIKLLITYYSYKLEQISFLNNLKDMNITFNLLIEVNENDQIISK